MKYKAKFSTSQNGIISSIEKGEIFESNAHGVIAFIPFSNTDFFEPVKTRKFEIEVSEKDMGHFEYVNADEPWIVTEITTPSWITKYKSSGSYNVHAFSDYELSMIDTGEFIDDYKYGNKLQGVKWLKERFGKGLRESKELADFIFALSI